MERGRKYIYFFFNGFISFSSSFFLSIVSSGSEQQTITHTRLIRRALCGVLRRSLVGVWSNFLFLFLYFYGVRIYFYEAISKLKRSISLVERRRNGEEEGRSVMMRGGGGKPYCTSDLRPSKNGTHVNIWMEKDTIHLEYVNSTRHRMEKETKSTAAIVKMIKMETKKDPSH